MRKADNGGKKTLFMGGYILFTGVICCSGGLYGCPGGLCTVQEGYMLNEILMFIVAS